MTLVDEFYENTHNDPAKRILFGILSDFTDRRGLSDEWDQIDIEIQEEILETWLKIIEKELKP